MLAAILALIAGYVDAILTQVYGSFLSGNTTQPGLQVGQGKLGAAAYNLFPIPLFVAGVFLGALFVHSRLGDELRWLFLSVVALLAVGVAAVALGAAPGWFSIIVLSLAMGIMNTSVTKVGTQVGQPWLCELGGARCAQPQVTRAFASRPSCSLTAGENNGRGCRNRNYLGLLR